MDINFSIGRIVLLTYIIIASNSCTNLFSKGLQQAIQDNRMVQHLILLILIMSLIIIFGNPLGTNITNNEQLNIVIMTLLVYVWFIMTTKLSLAWNVGILILLAIYFLFESKQISETSEIMRDTNLSKDKKEELYKLFMHHQQYLMLAIFGVTLTGTFFYSNEQKEQHGGGFSYYRYFFY